VGVPLTAALAWRLQVAGKRYSSLAVLPLENLSNDADQEWFSDGMTDTLIFELSKLRSINVISRTSVMQYKTQRTPLRAIAAELGVDVVVEGSALRSGERALVKVSLIDAAADRHLWANEYQRAFADVISLHRELALAIAGEIKAALTEDERQELGPAKPVDPEAMEAYFKSQHFTTRGPRYFPQPSRRRARPWRCRPTSPSAIWPSGTACRTSATSARSRTPRSCPRRGRNSSGRSTWTRRSMRSAPSSAGPT
jgi:TolB-like protein